MSNTTPDLPPCRVDEKAFAAVHNEFKLSYREREIIKAYESARQQPIDSYIAGQPIAEYLERLLYAGEASSATIAPQTVETAQPPAPAPTVADLDVLKEVRNMVSNGINLRHFPTIQDALREIDTLIQQHEKGR